MKWLKKMCHGRLLEVVIKLLKQDHTVEGRDVVFIVLPNDPDGYVEGAHTAKTTFQGHEGVFIGVQVSGTLNGKPFERKVMFDKPTDRVSKSDELRITYTIYGGGYYL